VLIDGRRALACLTLAIACRGKSILTIEGVEDHGRLDPIQEAFVEKGAIQCGYCTPGMVLSAKALLDENPHPSREEIARGMSGNLCRCTGYVKIIEAVAAAAHRRAAAAGGSQGGA
jgi:carbon-monoxide dehydrogenase small subunit